jgi:hypothetical protein
MLAAFGECLQSSLELERILTSGLTEIAAFGAMKDQAALRRTAKLKSHHCLTTNSDLAVARALCSSDNAKLSVF